jgi:hypothetical protein
MGQTKAPPPEEGADHGHAFACRTNRFALDALLRKLGWRIRHRRRNQESVWEKGGELLKQSEIMARLDGDQVQDARYLSDLYFQGYRE